MDGEIQLKMRIYVITTLWHENKKTPDARDKL